MLRISLWTTLFLLGVTQISYAGFEWLPPEDKPMQKGANDFNFDIAPPPVAERAGNKMITPVYQSPNTAPMPLIRPPSKTPIANAYSSSAYGSQNTMSSRTPVPHHSDHAISTASSGISQSMSSYLTTAPNRATTKRQHSSAPTQPVSLRIDPFPLGTQSTNIKSREIRPTNIEQAMMEISGNVTPMPLGQNMQTGAQIAYTNQPTIIMPTNNPVTNMVPKKLPPIRKIKNIQSAPKKAPIAARNFAKIEGFGSDLPLALALSQVLPSGFDHSFALGVDPDTTVSWKGGKAWNNVLQDMLRSHGLTADIKSDTVTIQPL